MARPVDTYAYSIVMPDGTVEKMTQAQLRARTGHKPELIRKRIARGWRKWEQMAMPASEGLRQNREKMRRLLTAETEERQALKAKRRA